MLVELREPRGKLTQSGAKIAKACRAGQLRRVWPGAECVNRSRLDGLHTHTDLEAEERDSLPASLALVKGELDRPFARSLAGQLGTGNVAFHDGVVGFALIARCGYRSVIHN